MALPEEKPILFNSEMVRTILQGKKTMSRIALTEHFKKSHFLWTPFSCPFGNIGAHLWVKEKWAVEKSLNADPPSNFRYWPVWFAADGAYFCIDNADSRYGFHNPKAIRGKWRSAVHMPRWASRITLRITNVRIDLLQRISINDIKKEGVDPIQNSAINCLEDTCEKIYKDNFIKLWDSTAKDGKKWRDNPWVWVLEFERV